ncbi:hypothetical protein D3C73_1245540 [compost metagenome]
MSRQTRLTPCPYPRVMDQLLLNAHGLFGTQATIRQKLQKRLQTPGLLVPVLTIEHRPRPTRILGVHQIEMQTQQVFRAQVDHQYPLTEAFQGMTERGHQRRGTDSSTDSADTQRCHLSAPNLPWRTGWATGDDDCLPVIAKSASNGQRFCARLSSSSAETSTYSRLGKCSSALSRAISSARSLRESVWFFT